MFDTPWYTALASVAHGNANFSRVTAAANYARAMQITGRVSF